MKTGVPRIVREIDDDVLQTARRAARQSGRSLSGWLNDLIVRQAAAEGIANRRTSEGHPNREALSAALERLTRRVRAMDENSRAVLADLHTRLDEIVERLDGEVATKRHHGERTLEDVGSAIGDLLSGIDSADEAARSMVEGLVAQDQRAQASFETPSGAEVDRLAAIEGELAAVRRGLEAAPNPDVTARLDRRVEELTRTVEVSLSAANDASRLLADDAVGRLDARLNAVLEHLKAIRDRTGDASAEQKTDIVGALRDILERDPPWLAEIRAQIAEISRRVGSGREGETTIEREPLRATGTYGVVAALTRGGPEPPAGGPTAAPPRPADGDRSTPPHSIRPDLAALRELARSVAQGGRETPAGIKADFIAAARRAAQVAAEEEDSSLSIGQRAGNDKPGTLARIGQAIRGRRRILLMALAAMCLAASAVQVIVVETDHARSGKTAPSNAAGDDAGGDFAAEPVARNATEPLAMAKSRGQAMAVAFAAPEGLDGRFDDTPPTPTRAFVRTVHRASQLPIDEAVGSAKLRRAAAAGKPAAAMEVAARYAEGRLVPREMAKAAKWYELAAEEGNAVARYRIASLYERGEGVKEDSKIAAAWYRRAAEQGNTGAMHNLGVMMSNGIEGTPDHREAARWFRAAAERGVQDSQYNLGVLYARGMGVERNLIESYKWFALAAVSGDVEAAARRDEIDEALSPGDRTEAYAAADAWAPVPAEARANSVASLPDAWAEPTAGITEADRRSLVAKIQTLLAEHGYDPGPADGLEGPKTRQAVRAFQRSIGLAETGRISSDLVAALVDPSN